MSNTEAIIAVAFLVVFIYGVIIYAGGREARRIRQAAAILDQAGSAAPGTGVPAGGVCFRKRRSMCLLYVLLFLALGPGVYLYPGKPGRNMPPPDTLARIADACVAAVPLLLAVRRWKYRVILAEHDMRIDAFPFAAQTIRFDQVDAIQIQTSRSVSNCVIQLNDGTKIEVEANLKDFLSFTAVLSRQVRAARSARLA